MSVMRKVIFLPGTSSEQSNKSPVPYPGKRPSLVVLLNTHHLNMPLLAKMSGVSLLSLRRMLMNQPVAVADIYAVLTVFNLCYGTHYTLESTLIPVL